jgi:hypothetical protein
MTWLRIFIHRLRGLFLKRKLEQDLEDEIRAHLDMQIEDNLRMGMSPEEARYEALRKFGGVEQIKESYRDRSRISYTAVFKGTIESATKMNIPGPMARTALTPCVICMH